METFAGSGGWTRAVPRHRVQSNNTRDNVSVNATVNNNNKTKTRTLDCASELLQFHLRFAGTRVKVAKRRIRIDVGDNTGGTFRDIAWRAPACGFRGDGRGVVGGGGKRDARRRRSRRHQQRGGRVGASCDRRPATHLSVTDQGATNRDHESVFARLFKHDVMYGSFVRFSPAPAATTWCLAGSSHVSDPGGSASAPQLLAISAGARSSSALSTISQVY